MECPNAATDVFIDPHYCVAAYTLTMDARSFLSSWTALWFWAEFLEKALYDSEWVRAFTHRKDQLELQFLKDTEQPGMTWSRSGSSALLSFHANTTTPRKRVELFRTPPDGLDVEGVGIHAVDRALRIRFTKGYDLVLGFYPAVLNAFLLRNSALIDQFFKLPLSIELSDEWIAPQDAQYLLEDRWQEQGFTGKPSSTFTLDKRSRRLFPDIDGVDISKLTFEILASGPVKTRAAVNWVKQGRTVLKRWRRKLKAMRDELETSKAWTQWEIDAQALSIALGAGVKPVDGDISLPSELSPTGRKHTVQLDPDTVNLQDMIDRLFKRVRKARARIDQLDERIPVVQKEIDELEELIKTGDDMALKSYLEEHGESEPGTSAQPAVRRSYRQTTSPSGFDILIGRSSQDNDTLTFKIASKQDWWFHARGVPGSHVVLRTGKVDPPLQDVKAAALEAARHSEARNSGVVVVQYCQRKHISKPRKSTPGVVLVHKEKTITVDLGD